MNIEKTFFETAEEYYPKQAVITTRYERFIYVYV